MDWAVLIATKPHGISSRENRRNQSLVCGDQDRESLRWAATMPVRGEYDEPDGSNPAIAEGKTALARRNGAAEGGVGGPGKSRAAGGKGISHAQGAEAYVSGRSQENRGGPACTLGKMEEKQANQVKDIVAYELVFNALRRFNGQRGIYWLLDCYFNVIVIRCHWVRRSKTWQYRPRQDRICWRIGKR